VTPDVPDKVLVVRLGAIGDVTNALVFATALKDAHPAVRVGWVVHGLARPLVEGHPAVDRVHPWPRGEAFGGVVRALRAERYGLAVDLQRITKSALLARLSGAPRVLGYDRGRAKEGSWLWTRERIPAGDPRAHMVEQYMEFARYLGAGGARPRRVLPFDAAAEAAADALVGELGSAPVVVSIGATKPPNRWEPARFGRLAAAVADELDAPVVLSGAPNERDVGGLALAATGGSARVYDRVGATDLRELAALLARARLFVGCDTGPMHIAAAVGTPVVALFGPADARRTGPYGEGHQVVQAPNGSMDEIRVEDVLAAVRVAPAAQKTG
jgi:ADP-heptose:LPS heptosyltransferase